MKSLNLLKLIELVTNETLLDVEVNVQEALKGIKRLRTVKIEKANCVSSKFLLKSSYF